MTSAEVTVRIDAVRIPKYRDSYGSCLALAKSIDSDGMHRPLTLWSDGTLISGGRRLRASMLLDRNRIQAVFVNNIEDAAKRMLGDNQDEELAMPWKWSEVARLWETLRRLDGPAAAKRLDEARRRGVELRRETQAGKRKPGRASNHSDDYTLTVICEPFDISCATARRIESVWQTGYGTVEATDEKRALARQIMAELDAGASIWSSYQRLLGHDPDARRRVHPKPLTVTEAAPAARQTTAWDRSLPQLEGLIAGLIELGPPNPELTWEQVGPVHTRLMVVRRELEKMINRMKETNKS